MALCADNSLEWIIADLAAADAGICIVPLPLFFSASQLESVLKRSGADAILVDSNRRGWAASRPGAKVMDLPSCPGLSGFTISAYSQAEAKPEQTGKITFTSGSTGAPKGVCLTHESVLLQAQRIQQSVAVQNPRHLCLLPLSTLLENIAGVYAPLLAGGEVIVPSAADLGFQGSQLQQPDKLLAMISMCQPSTLILVPELLSVLIHAAQSGWQPPSSLEFIAVGGGRVSHELLAQAESLALPVFEGYGLSECASVVTLNTPQQSKVGSCGRALPGTTIATADSEILVSGSCMLGYLGEPDSWGQTVIHTGDIGHIDQHGFLSIGGRKKNVLISSMGRNISPEWVESEMLANPGIAEVVVLGDAKPFLVALIAIRDASLTAQHLAEWIARVNDGLPDYARVKRWCVLPKPMATIPGLYTKNGRPVRHAIETYYEQELAALYRESDAA